MIVSGMTMEEIFKERQLFKNKVIENVQTELNQFGLRIYNANVKELQDTAGSEYFKFLSRKAHEGASNQAKVDVANACMMGEIGVCMFFFRACYILSRLFLEYQAASGARGSYLRAISPLGVLPWIKILILISLQEAEKRGKTKQEISRINAETAVLETKRKSEKATADAEFTTTQTKLNMGINLENIQASRRAEAKDAELQREVEVKRAEMELERMRAYVYPEPEVPSSS